MNQLISIEEGKTAGGIFYRRSISHAKGSAGHQTLVMVMGYGGSLRIWPQTLIDKLAEKYDVITYDNRGTGLSFLPEDDSQYTTSTMASDVDDVVRTLGLSHFHLMGYSMGGCIALEYAHLFPDKVQSLFLLSTTGGGTLFAKPDKALSLALARPAGNNLWEVYISTFSLMYSPEAFQRVEPKLKALYESSKSHPTRPKALSGHSHAFKYFDAASYLAQLSMPVAIISGANDRIMPAQNSHNLAQAIRHAHLVIVPECEHGVHIEQEDLVVSEIDRLVGQAEGHGT